MGTGIGTVLSDDVYITGGHVLYLQDKFDNIASLSNCLSTLIKKGWFDIHVNNSYDNQPYNYLKNHVSSLIIYIATRYQSPFIATCMFFQRMNMFLVDINLEI